MEKKNPISDFMHDMPEDLNNAIHANKKILELWDGLTPLARNEWICWVTSVKKQETRDEHLVRMCEDFHKVKKRPCCWPGCPHRRESAKKWFK